MRSADIDDGRNTQDRGTKSSLADLAQKSGYLPPPPKFTPEGGAAYLVDPIDYSQLLLDPHRTALLVIDMQNVFVSTEMSSAAPDGESITTPINALAATFRDLDQPVIWTIWCHRPDGSNLGPNAVFWRGIAPLVPDGKAAQIHSSLNVSSDDLIVRKPNYSAFWGTDLEAILSTRGIKSLVFTGVATDICVQQTVVDAFHRGYQCVVVSDATATTTPYQEPTLWMHENYWARVLTTKEVERELQTLRRALA